MKKRSIIRIAVNILSFGMLFFYFVYMLRVYGDFPEEIGIHFGEDNEFDVYYSKWLAFFPFMAGFGLAIVFTVGDIAVSRAKCISKKLSEDDTSDENVHIRHIRKRFSETAIINYTVGFYSDRQQSKIEEVKTLYYHRRDRSDCIYDNWRNNRN